MAAHGEHAHFVNCLRACLGLAPLYPTGQVPDQWWTSFVGDGNRVAGKSPGSDQASGSKHSLDYDKARRRAPNQFVERAEARKTMRFQMSQLVAGRKR